ncbi:hypothetical protein [Bacteriophage sp.]|nr:hypothetical protein [Bacteriophage sp.]
MADIATLIVTPTTNRVEAGGSVTFEAEASGELLLQNGEPFDWQNLDDCSTDAANRLTDTASGASVFGIAGATNTNEIASGDGWVEFLATVPFADPVISYPVFGGRAFTCGLSGASSVNDIVQIDFCWFIFEGGAHVFESGVDKGKMRSARNNGRYYVGIEGGVVVYRIDGELVYRSDGSITYPLRGAAAFVNRSTDAIGGTADTTYTVQGYEEAGSLAGDVSGLTWTAPNERGLYRVIIRNAQYLYGSAIVEVAETFPNHFNTNCFPCPTAFRQLRAVDDWRVNEQVYDDQSATYKIPTPAAEPVRRWQVDFSGLTQVQAELLDAFFDRHRGKSHWFYLHDYRANEGVGYTWDNVRFERYSAPSYKKIYSQSRSITLVRRPV